MPLEWGDARHLCDEQVVHEWAQNCRVKGKKGEREGEEGREWMKHVKLTKLCYIELHRNSDHTDARVQTR